jgi:branched-chain amino acid transport system permease protein
MAILTTILELATVIFTSFGQLVVVSLGLAIIFGMMGIINLAHGEFIMAGAYMTGIAYTQGVPLVFAVLFGGIATGVMGLFIERVALQFLYDRPIDSMVATWGLSLILVQATLLIFGPTFESIPTPFGTLSYGAYSTSAYRLVLSAVGVLLLGAIYAVFYYTEFGLHARATMQDAETARSLGVDTQRIYMVTFLIGSVVTGIAGGLFAPILTLVPTLGEPFIIDAFVMVIVGGANILLGIVSAGASLSVISGIVDYNVGSLASQVALLVAAIVVIRVYPNGISDYLERRYDW